MQLIITDHYFSISYSTIETHYRTPRLLLAYIQALLPTSNPSFMKSISPDIIIHPKFSRYAPQAMYYCSLLIPVLSIYLSHSLLLCVYSNELWFSLELKYYTYMIVISALRYVNIK